MKWMLRHGMKIIRITAGVAIILIGMGLGFIPGIPGFPLVFVGLTILAVDFVWARRLKQRLKDEATKVMDKIRGKQASGGPSRDGVIVADADRGRDEERPST